jgi:hypothetical protein
MPEVLERQAHHSAFRFCRSRERGEILRAIFRVLVFRRRLLWGRVRLPLMCVEFRIKLHSDENDRAAVCIQRPFHNPDARPLKSE